MSRSAQCIESLRPISADHRLQVCEHCDTVYRAREPARGEVSRCLRCNAVLARHHGLGTGGMLALVVTALIVFVIANVWPIVTLGLSGQLRSATLWGTIITMWQQGSEVVAVLAALTLFFFPLNKMLMLGWVLWFARHGRRAPLFRPIMVTLHYLQPWTMSEVFVLGALVAIVKAGTYFDVIPDAGIYAYAALTLVITVFSGIDLRRLWDVTPEPSRACAVPATARPVDLR
jgi:paraquat-inducible protein A